MKNQGEEPVRENVMVATGFRLREDQKKYLDALTEAGYNAAHWVRKAIDEKLDREVERPRILCQAVERNADQSETEAA